MSLFGGILLLLILDMFVSDFVDVIQHVYIIFPSNSAQVVCRVCTDTLEAWVYELQL